MKPLILIKIKKNYKSVFLSKRAILSFWYYFTQTYSVGTWSEQTLSSNSTVYDSGRLILFFNFRPDSRSMILGAFSNIFLLQCRSLDTSSAGILLSGLRFVEHFIFLGVLVRNEPDEFLNKRLQRHLRSVIVGYGYKHGRHLEIKFLLAEWSLTPMGNIKKHTPLSVPITLT